MKWGHGPGISWGALPGIPGLLFLFLFSYSYRQTYERTGNIQVRQVTYVAQRLRPTPCISCAVEQQPLTPTRSSEHTLLPRWASRNFLIFFFRFGFFAGQFSRDRRERNNRVMANCLVR